MGATVTAEAARDKARRAARAVGSNGAAQFGARAGFAARGVFYLLLAYLTLRVAFDRGAGGRPANSHGALTVIAQDVVGKALIAAAALGFLVLGVVRVAGAVRDREADAWHRFLTGAQGVFYLGLTWVPLSFLLGNRSTGSEQAQRRESATIVSWPGGRFWIIVVGGIVLGVCIHQIRSALVQDFTDGIDMRKPPRWVRSVLLAAGSVGIDARALVFVPIAVFLFVYAVTADAQTSVGLDQELGTLARQSWWGPAVLVAVAVGLVLFAVYSLLEGAYRKVGRSE
jgi:hypothetical protein